MNFGEAKTRTNYTDKFEMLLTRACIGCYAVKVCGGGYNGQLYWGVVTAWTSCGSEMWCVLV
jgi:hypothetical protein